MAVHRGFASFSLLVSTVAATWGIPGGFAPALAAAQSNFTFVVEDTRDASDLQLGDGPCRSKLGNRKCTLRAALEEIAYWAPSCDVFDRVVMPAGYYQLAGNTDRLRVGGPDGSSCVHIQGAPGVAFSPAVDFWSSGTVIDGNGGDGDIHGPHPVSVLYINGASFFVLDGVTITKGHDHRAGGAIWNDGGLQIYDSWLTGNSTHGQGGAIFNRGQLWINESTISNNFSELNFSDLGGAGGGIANWGGSALLYNVTVSGNRSLSSSYGAGILNTRGGVIGINNGTIANNSSDSHGGGIFNGAIDANRNPTDDGSVAEIWNTLLAGNTAGSSGKDCFGVLTSFGYNLVARAPSFDDCIIDRATGDQIGESFPYIDAKLFGLGSNGGPVPTHALDTGSPAIDRGNPDPVREFACAETDARHLPRPKDGPAEGAGFDGTAVCDVGGYEYAAPKISVRDKSVTEGNSGTKNMVFRVVLEYAHVQPVTVSYSTTDGTAKAGSDYAAASGSLTFDPGRLAKKVVVKVFGDTAVERNETFSLNIASPSFARIGRGSAVGTVVNDD